MGRETKLSIPKTEQFYYDGEGNYKPLAVDGAIPVTIASGGLGGSGMRLLHGDGAPINDGNALEGDYYIDTMNGDMYKKSYGDWEYLLSLKGPKGDKGDKGDKGNTGDAGAVGKTGEAGKDGKDGFGTEEQYNDIINRLIDIENKLDGLVQE